MEIAPYIHHAQYSGLCFAVIFRIAAEELLEEPVNPVRANRRKKHEGAEIVYCLQSFFPCQFYPAGTKAQSDLYPRIFGYEAPFMGIRVSIPQIAATVVIPKRTL